MSNLLNSSNNNNYNDYNIENNDIDISKKLLKDDIKLNKNRLYFFGKNNSLFFSHNFALKWCVLGF